MKKNDQWVALFFHLFSGRRIVFSKNGNTFFNILGKWKFENCHGLFILKNSFLKRMKIKVNLKIANKRETKFAHSVDFFELF